LHGGTFGDFARDGLGLETRRAFLNEEAADVAVVVPCPDDGHIGIGGSADPALGSVEDVVIAIAMGTSL